MQSTHGTFCKCGLIQTGWSATLTFASQHPFHWKAFALSFTLGFLAEPRHKALAADAHLQAVPFPKEMNLNSRSCPVSSLGLGSSRKALQATKMRDGLCARSVSLCFLDI